MLISVLYILKRYQKFYNLPRHIKYCKEFEMTKYMLVRTPKALITKDKIGIGWSKVNFSQFATAKELVKELKSIHPKFSRARKQVERFFNLKQGDIIIIPSYKSILLAIVSGEKTFNPDFDKGHGANQISVNYLKQADGKLLRIARSHLTEGLERRLKIYQAVADLKDFSKELDKLVTQKDNFSLESEYLQILATKQEVFKDELLMRLRHGKTRLDTGGLGLEKLIKELLQLEGYINVITPSKHEQKGIADVDIIAKYASNPFAPTLLIQAKHHRGESNSHAIKQLTAYNYEDDPSAQRWMITTANIDDETEKEAETQGINVMLGDEFVEWLSEHLLNLSDETKARLGLGVLPSFIEI